MSYNFVADSFHTKKLCSRLSSSEVRFLQFFSPHPFGWFRAKYNNHLRLIGKCLLDFLLVLIELFSLRVSDEALRANIG